MKVLNFDGHTIENPTQKTGCIVGGKGSGKTVTLKLIALQSSKIFHTFIIDPLDIINIKGFNKIVVDKKSCMEGAQLGKILNSTNEKDNIIISLKNMLNTESVKFVNDMFAAWKPHDDMVFIDEIHEFVPQHGGNDTYAFELERAVKHLRNKNVGFLFNTQRPAFCNKNVLALCDYYLVYRMTYPIDTKLMEELTNQHLDIENKAFLHGYLVDFRNTEKTTNKNLSSSF